MSSAAKQLTSRFAHLPWVAAGVLCVCLVVQGVEGFNAALQYDRAAVAAGERWRLFSSHLAHWSWDHLFWDAVVFAALGAWLERADRRRFVALLVASAAAISAGVWFWRPEMTTYRGLSGLDTALFTAVAGQLLAQRLHERAWGAAAAFGLLLFGFAAKTAYEAAGGPGFFVDAAEAGFTPAPLAHLIGAAVGSACVAPQAIRLVRRHASSKSLRLAA